MPALDLFVIAEANLRVEGMRPFDPSLRLLDTQIYK